MFDAFGLTLLLLPLATAFGWYLHSRFKPPEEQPPPKTQYLQGVQHLVNDETDKAIDVFIKLLDVDHDTLDTHLALGSLFRRRGEVDRALRIHQNLVARANLAPKHRNRARYELAQDYLKAGVLDRAESLYRELLEQGMFQDKALAALISIYEKERDWGKALEATRKQEGALGRSQRERIAQYMCELAEEAIWKHEPKTAAQWLKKALAENRDCVRASLLQARLLQDEGDHRGAIKALLRVPKQDAQFVGEIIAPLKKAFQALDDQAGLTEKLGNLASSSPLAAVQVANARQLHATRGNGDAYLADFLAEAPSWTAFLALLELTDAAASPTLAGPLDSLQKALHHTLNTAPLYRCEHCGFAGRGMHWQCPSCLHWESVLPVDDVTKPKAG